MKRLACFLFCAAFIVAAQRLCPAFGSGLYDDLPSYFSARDTSRTLVTVRQTELNLTRGDASVLFAAVDFGIKSRYELHLGVSFPCVRIDGAFVYGVGDMTLHATARLLGDTLSSRGLLLRADARIPTATEDFFPFSADSILLGCGFELRGRVASTAVRGAVLYTLARERRIDRELVDGNHLTAAASVGVSIAPRTEVIASAFFIRFDGGDSREIALITLRERLSRSVEVALDGALETGVERARAFDAMISVALLYAFPPRERPPKPQTGTP